MPPLLLELAGAMGAREAPAAFGASQPSPTAKHMH